MTAVLDFLGARLETRRGHLCDKCDHYAVDAVSGTVISIERHAYYADSIEDPRRNYAAWPNVKLVQGTLPNSLDELGNQIAFSMGT